MLASRWRDAWNIDLRWSPPPMPAWDTDRRLARLLSSVQIIPGLDPALSSEDEIIAAVQALPSDVGAGPDDLWPLIDWPPGSPPSSPPAPVVYRLPAETAADALDRIFTVWVTEVRPQLAPDLTQPPDGSDAAILLASITFTLGPVSSPPSTDPVIATCDPPNDRGRPYVLHTRLIQELRLLAEESTAQQVQELATLTSDVDDQGRLILTAWFHLDQPVALTESVQVISRSGAHGSFDPSAPADPSGVAPQFSYVWILTQNSDFPVIDRDQVAVAFMPGSVLVGDPDTTLADRIAQGLDLLDATVASEVVVFGTVDVPPPPPDPPPPPPPTREFVTITPVIVKPPVFEFEFWFHPQPQELRPEVFVSDLPPGRVALLEERTGKVGQVLQVRPQPGTNMTEFIFELPGLEPAPAYYFRFVFDATVQVIDKDGQLIEPILVEINRAERLPLLNWMKKARFVFLNWDPAEQAITAFLRVESPQ
jgi:hypothetical protein